MLNDYKQSLLTLGWYVAPSPTDAPFQHVALSIVPDRTPGRSVLVEAEVPGAGFV